MTDTQPPEQYDARALVSMYDRMRRNSARLILAGLLVAIVAVVIVGLLQPTPPQPDVDRVGVHLLLDDGRNRWPLGQWPQHLDAAARISGANGIVVQVIRADDLDVARWQTFLDLAAERDLRPVLRLATTFDRENRWWRPPADDLPGRYADFLAALDWGDTPPTVAVLNEPNNGHEWGGRPDPAAYARFATRTIAALRAAVPDVVILNAALDLYAPNTGDDPLPGTDLHHIDADTFLEAVHAAQPDLLSQFDLWNSHPYPQGAFIAPPWEQTFTFDDLTGVADIPAPPPGIVNRGVNGYTWELWKLEQLGVTPPPVMITEMGYRHRDSVDPASLDAGAGYPDAVAAARLLDMALRGNPGRYPNAPRSGWTPLLSDDRVVAVAIFALAGVPDEWGHTNLLRVTPDGAFGEPYPAFDLLAGYR